MGTLAEYSMGELVLSAVLLLALVVEVMTALGGLAMLTAGLRRRD